MDLSALMSAPALNMQVDGIEWNQSPIVEKDIGRTGSTVSATIDGFISCRD